MKDKSVTVIISDLHLGGGIKDSNDDHVFDNNQLKKFIRSLKLRKEGEQGKVELIINGDFLEFAQVSPETYSLNSGYFWCSQDESLRKLEAIIDGHPDIFNELKNFQDPGNKLTIAAGNHDVDLYWPAVQSRICEVAGPNIQFELGRETYSRYGGKLVIGHGHMHDPANRFKHWDNPILNEPSGPDRLEMCPGTLFMVKFVNKLEKKYPFADNIIPETALGAILRKEDKASMLLVAGWLSWIVGRHPVVTLGTEKNTQNISKHIRQKSQLDSHFQNKIVNLYREVINNDAAPTEVTKRLETNEGMWEFLDALFINTEPNVWLSAFDFEIPTTLNIRKNTKKKKGKTLSIIRSGFKNEKFLLRDAAKQLFHKGAEIVVFGHTHQPDILEDKEGRYYNPGSWTRYLNLEDQEEITLNDLRNEADYPYSLNYIQVTKGKNNIIESEFYCFEKKDGKRFNN